MLPKGNLSDLDDDWIQVSHPASQEEVEEIGLRYSSSDEPGIIRLKKGRGFAYYNSRGERVSDLRILGRIRSLVIPPAWQDVWICRYSTGHVQAVGRDARGRRQAIYHVEYRAHREQVKFDALHEFGEVLPELRKQVDADLRRTHLSRERVLAVLVRLLEETLIRIGNQQYANSNDSYGLTTLRSDHVEANSSTLRFQFRGKSGKEHTIFARDRRAIRVVRQCQDLPGQALFQYLDESGEPRAVTSGDVNDYLRSVTGTDFTAKHFRTWAATRESIRRMRETEDFQPKLIPSIVKDVAALLGNTPTVCRKSYIHPRVLEPWQEPPTWLTSALPRNSSAYFEPVEKIMMRDLLIR